MSAPDALLDAIKDDLGITDGTQDAWLQRRLNGIWSRIEHYTSRVLASPPAAFVDDWSLIVVNNRHYPVPPSREYVSRASVFLRYFPVASIEAVEINGAASEPADVQFDPSNGKLFTLTGSLWSEDLSARLHHCHTKITYKAGWDEVPGDLYEIVLGSMQTLWAPRSAGASGGISGTISEINVIDVGSVQMQAGNEFVQGASKAGSAQDPLLGPYLSMLDLYVDHRSLIGHATMPVTTAPVVVAP
jgi:hypothetical protein